MEELQVEEIGEEVPEYTFDPSQMPITSKLQDMHQEGNYLVGVSDTGVRFRQRIPQGKILDKDSKGNWIFKNIEIRETAKAL